MARVLLVEDYESLQSVYFMALKEAGHTVEVVDDGMTALQAAEKGAYDVIVLDLLLPHMSGMEFLRAFKPKEHPATKVLVCSNFTSPKYMTEAAELGVIHHLTKSNVTPKEMAMVVETLLKEP